MIAARLGENFIFRLDHTRSIIINSLKMSQIWYSYEELRFDFRYVSNYYSGGDICDLTGEPRTTEVKLKYV